MQLGLLAEPSGDADHFAAWKFPKGARFIIVFAHGNGSSRFSPRNNEVADALFERGFATLLFDVLTDGGGNSSDQRLRYPLAR